MRHRRFQFWSVPVDPPADPGALDTIWGPPQWAGTGRSPVPAQPHWHYTHHTQIMTGPLRDWVTHVRGVGPQGQVQWYDIEWSAEDDPYIPAFYDPLDLMTKIDLGDGVDRDGWGTPVTPETHVWVFKHRQDMADDTRQWLKLHGVETTDDEE